MDSKGAKQRTPLTVDGGSSALSTRHRSGHVHSEVQTHVDTPPTRHVDYVFATGIRRCGVSTVQYTVKYTKLASIGFEAGVWVELRTLDRDSRFAAGRPPQEFWEEDLP